MPNCQINDFDSQNALLSSKLCILAIKIVHLGIQNGITFKQFCPGLLSYGVKSVDPCIIFVYDILTYDI